MLKILQQTLHDFYRLSDHFVKTRHYKVNYFCESIQSSQLIFTCSKSTIKILEEGVKYVQS